MKSKSVLLVVFIVLLVIVLAAVFAGIGFLFAFVKPVDFIPSGNVAVISISGPIMAQSSGGMFGSGAATSTEIVEYIEKVSSKKIKIVRKTTRKVDIDKNMLEISKVKEKYKWEPLINIEEGVRRTWNWAYEKYS